MTELRYPHWQEPYLAALTEFEPHKLRELVTETETAMFARLRALESSSDGHEEKQAIADASQTLFTLKREFLKFPGLDS